MATIKIDESGITVPVFGDMKITVEMTEAVFEEFIAYRKEAQSVRRAAYRDFNDIKDIHNKLCNKVINALSELSLDEEITIENHEELKAALIAANDWFC